MFDKIVNFAIVHPSNCVTFIASDGILPISVKTHTTDYFTGECSTKGLNCSAILMKDGWQINSDYNY